MPYKDPEDQRKWLKARIAEGYGKAIYQVRRRHFDNEKILRQGVTDAVELLTSIDAVATKAEIFARVREMEDVLVEALVNAPPVVRGAMAYLREGE